MTNISKLEFEALDVSGENYLSWELDVGTHLTAQCLEKTITTGNTESLQNRAKALLFLRHHIHNSLKMEYLTVKDPLTLWDNLKERFKDLKKTTLPKAEYDFKFIRFEVTKTVNKFNSEMYRITSLLELCGKKITDDDKIERTLSTFHPSNWLLSQQYRERGFKKYCDLINSLQLAERNHELLMHNHESRPTGSKPAHEAQKITFPETNVIQGRGNGRGRGRRNDRGNNRGRGRGRGRGNNLHVKQQCSSFKKHVTNNDQNCFKCGMNDHWSRQCKIPPHLVALYQESLDKKKAEVNLSEYDDLLDEEYTYLESADFTNPAIDEFGDMMEDPNDKTVA